MKRDRPWNRKFLGFSFWFPVKGKAAVRIAKEALGEMKDRIRQLTRRMRGRSLDQVAQDLRSYLMGSKEYFQLAQTPRVFGRLDEWICHRLRALHLKHWKHGPKIHRVMRLRGLNERAAAGAASHVGRWWYGAHRTDLRNALPNALFDQMGVPRLTS